MIQYTCEIAVIGGGPAGLATANTLQKGGYDVMIFEKGCIAEHVSRYPVYMTWFSTADLLELGGFPMTIAHVKPTQQEYLAYLRRFVKEMKLNIQLNHEVTGLEGEDGEFVLSGTTINDEPFEAHACKIVLATGAYATPQMLNVRGENLPKVSHYFHHVHPYYGSNVLVVGGRNSAAEAALELWRAGIETSICHRAEKFRSLKYWIEPDIENRIKNGEIVAYRPAQILEIKPRSVVLDVVRKGIVEIENDFVLAMTGYRPDPDLLARFGIKENPFNNRPAFHTDTLESSRRGLYLVGVVMANNVSSEIFIENSRFHGNQILAHLKSGSMQPCTVKRS